jgi:hypothetical protein
MERSCDRALYTRACLAKFLEARSLLLSLINPSRNLTPLTLTPPLSLLLIEAARAQGVGEEKETSVPRSLESERKCFQISAHAHESADSPAGLSSPSSAQLNVFAGYAHAVLVRCHPWRTVADRFRIFYNERWLLARDYPEQRHCANSQYLVIAVYGPFVIL